MKAWSEVEASPDFAALAAHEQEAAREQYFGQIVAPRVPPDELIAARAQFDQATRIRKQDLPAGLAASTAGAGRGVVNPPAVQPVAQRMRGGLQAEARPYVPADDGMRPGEAGAGRGLVNPGEEDRRAFTLGQVGKDFQGGIQQVKGLATGAGAFGGAVDWRAATDTLADLDAVEMGQAPTRTAGMLPQAGGGAPRQGEPNPVVRTYMSADREGRKAIRQSLTSGLQRDQDFIAQSVQAIKAYNDEQQKLSGKMPDFTDVRTARDFAEWAVRNGAATAPTMAASMLGAAAGAINPALGVAGLAATSGGMALGDMTSARAEFAAGAFDPKRFTNPDRRDAAAAGQSGATAQHLADNVGATAALAVPYAALDFLGPAGTLARGGVKGLVKGGAAAVLKKGAREIGEEAINEGGQEVVNIGSDMLAGERPTEVTGADAKRVLNAAAVGGVMGAGGHAVNVAGDAGRAAVDKRARVKAAEGGDVEQALMLAIEASPYGRARAKGFNVDPPIASDPPQAQRAATEDVFRNAAAAYGIPKQAVDAAMQAAERKPLNELGGFFARATQALAKRGLAAREVDPEVLDAMAHGPIDPGTMSPAAEAVGSEDGSAGAWAPETPAAAAPVEDFTGLADPSAPPVIATPVDEAAHQAAHSPTNALPEPTDAQKEAGNYQKGHVRIGGLNIAIENPQGSVRRGTSPDGTAWENRMVAHYGYVKGTLAGDGDHSDVFVKPGTPEDYNGPVFVIDQVDPKTGKFDEHKSVIGAATEDEARALYQANYSKDWKGLGAITELPLQAFRSWVKDGTKRKPLGNINEPVSNLDVPAEQPAPAGADGSGQPEPSVGDVGRVAADAGRRIPPAPAPAVASGRDAAPAEPRGVSDAALKPIPALTDADVAHLDYEQLKEMHDKAIDHNKAVDLAGIRKFWGEQQATEAEGWSRRKREKWLLDNETVDASDWMQARYVNDDLLVDHMQAGGNFDTESPAALGRSIAITAKDADKPGFVNSPAGRTVRNAFAYAKEQGWSLDSVVAAMRGRAEQWAGSDAPELFARLYREARPKAANGPEVATGPVAPRLAGPAAAARIITRAGRTPSAAEPIELKPNADGTLTPHMSGKPMLDYDSAQPIVLPSDITDDAAKAAIRKAGAVSSKTNFFPASSTRGSAPAAPSATSAADNGGGSNEVATAATTPNGVRGEAAGPASPNAAPAATQPSVPSAGAAPAPGGAQVAQTPTTAPAAQPAARNDAAVEIRKRLSVLNALKECLA